MLFVRCVEGFKKVKNVVSRVKDLHFKFQTPNPDRKFSPAYHIDGRDVMNRVTLSLDDVKSSTC
jgi:hypothetical protein